MIDFSKRSNKKELLDMENIPFVAIRKNMQELNVINTLLGGHNITLRGIKKLIEKKTQLTVCEIGCGGGDNLLMINKWAIKQGIHTTLIGIDINKDCIAFAENNDLHKKVTYVHSDYKKVNFKTEPDVIFSSLFCHHFEDDELIDMLGWMKKNSKIGFFINDLHRHPLAYNFIRIATGLFSNSYLVKNDAPLSVLRGFKKKEWLVLFRKAGFEILSINWCWAYRYLIVCKNEK